MKRQFHLVPFPRPRLVIPLLGIPDDQTLALTLGLGASAFQPLPYALDLLSSEWVGRFHQMNGFEVR